MLLQQKYLGGLYLYEIDDTGLLIKIKKRNKNSEIHESFEKIGSNKEIKNNNDKGVLMLAGAGFSIVSLVLLAEWFIKKDVDLHMTLGLVMGAISITVFIFYFKERKKLILFNHPDHVIELYADIPSEAEVNNFIKTLIEARNKYLKERYSTFQRQVDYQNQYDNLNWLVSVRAISKAEYDTSLKNLNKLFNTESSSIGFVNRAGN